jgi:hypothetical protein
MRVAPQQSLGRQDHAWCAKSALSPELLVERALQPTQMAVRGQAFYRLDRSPLGSKRQHEARRCGFAVEENGAGATFAAVAAGFRPSKSGDVAEVIDKEDVVGDGIFTPSTVEPYAQNFFSASRLHARSRIPQQRRDNRSDGSWTMTNIKFGSLAPRPRFSSF